MYISIASICRLTRKQLYYDRMFGKGYFKFNTHNRTEMRQFVT